MSGTNVGLWSTTAANNASVGSINFAEGQAPSTVNDSARQLMADVRSFANMAADGWIEVGDTDGAYTATYVSSTSFKFSGVDLTSRYTVGRRVRIVAATPGTIYGTISSSAYVSDTTIGVTFDSGSLSNEAITSVHLGPAFTNTAIPAPAASAITGQTADTSPDTNNDYLLSYDASAAALKKVNPARFSTMPRGYLAGLGLANNGSDATNDIDIAVGQCRDTGNTADMVLAGALTKQLDAAWAVGTNQGMRATGVAIANGTYHIFLIRRSDTGVVDVAADTSVTGANIAANTNAAYTQIRRIGSILRESAAIVAFSQVGDEFLRKASVLDVSATNPGTSAVTRTLSVPTGVQVWAKIHAGVISGTGAQVGEGLISELDRNDEAPTTTGLFTFAKFGNIGGAGVDTGSAAVVRTNTSGQVRSRLNGSDAGTSLFINTVGWIDRRGRDD